MNNSIYGGCKRLLTRRIHKNYAGIAIWAGLMTGGIIMKEYKKSYRGFVILMVVFVVALFALPFIPNADAKAISIIVFNIMNLWMALVTFVIYKTEKIHWFTGILYEEALNTLSEFR